MSLETQYQALLRWYPRSWRTSHEAVLLGTLLDAAEAKNRTAPTVSEAWNIRWTGLGERFSLNAALIATLGALLCTLMHTAAVTFGLGTIAQVGGGWIPAALGQFLAPLLLSYAVLCLLRDSRMILPGRAVTVFACVLPAWALAATAAVSWSVGFEEADTGGIASPFALAFAPLFASAWALGAGTVFLLTHALLRKVPRSARWAGAASAAVVTPPLLGVALISPMTTAVLGLALLFVCAFQRGPIRTRPRSVPRAVTPATARRVTIVAGTTLAISVVCAAFALTGSTWTAGIDSTRAMQLGLCAGQLCAIPLMFCLAWIRQDRRPTTPVYRWFPVVTLALGLSLIALDTIIGFTPSGLFPWPGLVVIAMGLAVITFQMLRLSGSIRVLLAIVTGAALVFPVWLAIVMIGFLVPIGASAMMLWGLRNRRVRTDPAPALSA
ncbi:MAG TPA: hypothetical protein DIW46_09955 [Microbacterium sp.]|uniref:hypothetical protein n=1 Tax=Microbacterium sp. TaxID=51671 RepID=UPI000EE37422|nr:hypothetical protein [Microbacterium sp.]